MMERLRYMWHEVTPGAYVVGGITAALLPFVIYANHWSTWAFLVAMIAIVLGRGLAVYLTGGRLYQVGPLTVIWEPGTEDKYIPPTDYEAFLNDRWWFMRWSHKKWDQSFLLQDSEIRYVDGQPQAPAIDEDKRVVKSVHGYTYPEARQSVVWEEGVADMGVDGWELDLQAAHQAWGDKPESYDKARFEEIGIR